MATNNMLNVSLSGTTGTVNFVGANSPTLVTPTLGAASATSLAFSSTSEVIGTTTNDDAAAGSVGEFVSSTVLAGAAVPTTTGAQTDITSISLTAGDWDVWGTICTLPAAGTTTARVSGSIDETSGSVGVLSNYLYFGPSPATEPTYMPCPVNRISIASTTTIYLTASINFSVSTMSVFGFAAARRVR